jgi:uncharacterized coiled-coil protein SlyX
MGEKTIEQRVADLENRTANIENALAAFAGQLKRYLEVARSISDVIKALLIAVGQFGGFGGRK